MKFLKNEAVRGYLYRVACAAGAILVLKKVITDGELQVYLTLATALLGLASVNTSTKRD